MHYMLSGDDYFMPELKRATQIKSKNWMDTGSHREFTFFTRLMQKLPSFFFNMNAYHFFSSLVFYFAGMRSSVTPVHTGVPFF